MRSNLPFALACVGALTLFPSPSLHAVRVEANVAVPMRDGVKLQADIYRPDGDGPFPVVVTRTPYNRKGRRASGLKYAAAGYIAVCEDTRGRYGSGGEFSSFMMVPNHEAEDGYDTVEWAARLPRASGKVGTFGVSYDALLQWRLAALRPPSLVAMAASASPARMADVEERGTIRPGRRLRFWYETISPEYLRRSGQPGPHDIKESAALWASGEQNVIWFLPWLDLPDSVWGSAAEAEATRRYLRHPDFAPFQFDTAAPEVTVPNLCFTGWYDHVNCTIDLRQAMAANGGSALARNHQHLVIGPWIHSGYRMRKIGVRDFGPEATLDIDVPNIRWFDHWLKGLANGVEQDAPVRIFVQGVNQWRDEREWPLARAVRQELWLAGDRPNTPAGNGRLESSAPAAAMEGRYRYDPRDPVPTLWDERWHTVPADQRPLRYRNDVLVYQSAPLTAPMEVTGYPEVELFAASSAPDTDFFVHLIDVDESGRGIDVVSGMVRARYRDSVTQPHLLIPGEPTRFSIRLGPTSMRFPAGHRLRLDVTSSNFPDFDRNHNTAADQNADATLVTADQTVFGGGTRPSRLILPVIPANSPPTP